MSLIRWRKFLLLCLFAVRAAGDPFKMTWSMDAFGPDGPWQAVQITIGDPGQVVSLYPGGEYSSHILGTGVCSNSTLGSYCPTQLAGLYNNSSSDTASFGNIKFGGGTDYTAGALQLSGSQQAQIGTDRWNLGSVITSPNMDMSVHESIWGTLPDGTVYPVSVGSLALGAVNTINQTFSRDNGEGPINVTLLPGYLSTEASADKLISSNSYSLQIGSVSPKIAPTLLFGGYDQSRVLGVVSKQQGSPLDSNAIDVIDISLQVQDGGSPWAFNSQDGLLASGNSSIRDALPLSINSLAPYLHLPKSTCDAIAAYLPVTYQSRYQLYFWNTNDPQYNRIISSATSLDFTFRNSGSLTSNITISVPFPLLNLTLTSPLTTTNTFYFPCKAETQTNYQLGRAFLQAAFIGANWNANAGKGAWWLAQAPGPNTPSQSSIVPIANLDDSIVASSNPFTETWKGYWTPLSSQKSSTSATSSPSASSSASSGLSTGAKAGLGAGIGGAALVALIGIGFFFFRRRSQRSRRSQPPNYTAPGQIHGYYGPEPKLQTQTKYPVEAIADHFPQPQELA